jgi:putative nucleotidyltransferase-like protein
MTLSNQSNNATETGYAEKRLLAGCVRADLFSRNSSEPPSQDGEPVTTTAATQGQARRRGDAEAAVRQLAARPLDWEFVIAAAAENSVMPIVAKQLAARAADLVPAASLEKIKGAARANTLRCLKLTGELLRVLEEFRARGIEAISYKGPVLAVQAWGDVAMREYEDLDIVLRHRDVPKADEAMRALGYQARYPWIHTKRAEAFVPGEYNYREAQMGIIVELHTERTMRHFPRAIDLGALALRLTSVSLSGHEVRTFSPEDLIPILCVHGAKDYWERIIWVADIAALARRGSGCDWGNVVRRADEWRAGRMLRIGLALAVSLLGAELPRSVLERVEADETATAIATERAAALLERDTRRMAGAAVFRYRRKMVDGEFAGLRYALRLALAPAEEDWQAAKLPRGLQPLYAAMRPLRLLKKYGWGGRR